VREHERIISTRPSASVTRALRADLVRRHRHALSCAFHQPLVVGRLPPACSVADPQRRRDLDTFAAEAARLTKITGQRWTISGYLRTAGLAYAGKHLAGA
jgi:hypothetical protein